MQCAVWEVGLYVDGPVSIRRRMQMEQQKGFRVDDLFYSSLHFEPRPNTGFRANITARAADSESARQAGLVFFGQMLDSLTLLLNCPMEVSLFDDERISRKRHSVRRVVEQGEIVDAFEETRLLQTKNAIFLRALSWYRKGLCTENPLDAFLALYDSIELVASSCYKNIPEIDLDRAKVGSRNQMWACFQALWGECDVWPIIGGNRGWIDISNGIRNDVAHGRREVTVETVADVASRLDVVSKVAHHFLAGWRAKYV